MNAAIRVMAREGVAAASTRRIAAEAGVAQATIHYVFGTKTELYRAVLETAGLRLVAAIESGLGPRPRWADEVAGASHAAWDVIEEGPEIGLLLVELTTYALRDPELSDLARDLYDSYQRMAEHAIRALHEHSGRELLTPIEDVARVTVAGFNGLVMSHLVHRDHERSRRDLDNLVQALTTLAVGAEA